MDFFDEFSNDFNLTPDQKQELSDLNEIRQDGKLNDIVGKKILHRIVILQSGNQKE